MSESSQASSTPEPSPQNITKYITLESTWIRLYVPPAALNGPKKLPFVIYFHLGRYNLKDNFCNTMASDLNVVVALPSYRLASEHILPEAYQDGVDALMFISTSQDEWIKSYADISNVYLMGTGFGGNLAYNIGIGADISNLAPLRIRGLILHHPFFTGHEAEPNIIGRSGWKVLVSGEEGDPMIDRQRRVAKLIKEKGVYVVECFTDANVDDLPHLFASIRNLIHSSAP